MKSKMSRMKLFPVLFGFFIMGFVDVVGIATNYVKKDFSLSDTSANLIPMLVFLWFALCSIPTGMIMNRIGRRNTVLLSMGITAAAMLLPWIDYNFSLVLPAFAMLGIGNTILQVSLNPMVTQIVAGNRIASILTLGQFMKAVSSFLGPVIAGTAASCWGDWKLIFVVYAGTTILAAVWMFFSIESDRPQTADPASFRATLAMFSDKIILWLFIGIQAVVGIDVGLNTYIPKLLMFQTGLSLNEAGLGTSLYFVSRTAGTFIGAFLLTRTDSKVFMRICMLIAVAAFAGLLVSRELWLLLLWIVIIGLACSNVFSILFSYALKHKPEHANEISALMIMGVSGGALVMPFMGALSDWYGQIAGLLPLLLCLIYLLWTTGKLRN